MSYRFVPGVGTVHFNDAPTRRIVPGAERHRWAAKINWGQSTTCLRCGCQRHLLKSFPDYTERWQLAGTTELLSERPACTGFFPLPKPATATASK